MSVGLANILGLGYLLAVPALVLIYYFSRRMRRVEVSSIIPWRLLRESAVRRSLLRADLLFYLQLLLLLVLVMAACRPYWRGGGKDEGGRHVVMVMDRSASMQTEERGRSRWEMARERALRFVRRLEDGDRVTLIAAGAGPRVLAAGEGNRSRVERIIRGLDAADTPDRLAPAIELAVSLLGGGGSAGEEGGGGKAGATDIYIFTDRSMESLGIGELPAGGETYVERVGSPRGNVAITSLEVYRNLFSPRGEASAYVTVENFSREAFVGSLRVKTRGNEVASEKIRVAPGEALTTRVAGGRPIPEGEFEVVLEPPDALRLDNRAYGIAGGEGAARVLLVTRTGRPVSQFMAVAEAAPNLEIEVRRPGEVDMADMEAYRAAIFYRCEPEGEPATNVLLICPPVKSRFADLREAWVSDTRFIDWDESHPVGKNLRGLNNVPMSGSRLFDIPSWARPVVFSATTSGDAPLVFCGEYRGRKVAVTSFDVSGIEIKDADSMPALILVLNLLGWLCSDGGGRIKTGDAYEALAPAGGGGEGSRESPLRTVVDPRAREHSVTVDPEGLFVFAGTEYAGRYRVRGGAAERTFTANLFNREESDLYRDGSGEAIAAIRGKVPVRAAAMSAAGRSISEGSTFFLLLFLAILLIEWFFYAVGRKEVKAVKS